MHFAFPPRKSSNPPPYARRNNAAASYLQNGRLRLLALVALAALTLMWIIRSFSTGQTTQESIPYGTPGAVIVTMFDPKVEKDIQKAVMANREAYAAEHGYATFFPKSTDYDVKTSPTSWATIPSLRHAMTLWPHTPLFFYLAPSALIMEPKLSLESHIMDSKRLESLMIVDQPIVPPDSVIKTFSHVRGDRIDFVLAQDHEGLTIDSMVLRRGEWAKFFLDAWFDPLYRSYNFQKAELHALEHLVQWHGTILAKLALVPQRILNAYKTGKSQNEVYQEGDFVLSFGECARDPKRRCAKEMRPVIARLAAHDGHGAAGVRDAGADEPVPAAAAAAAATKKGAAE